MEALADAEKRLAVRIAERTAELAQANERLRESQLELSRLALQDGLTGLVNRIHLQEHLRLAVARSQRSGSGCGILMIDLDGFKAVNDTHGHAMGDALLKEVAKRLRSQVRASDLVARLGGDEFVVVFEPVGSAEKARALGDKLVAALSQPCTVGERSFTIGASIGIALAPMHGTELTSLLAQADRAMYEAKRLGKGRCEVAQGVTRAARGTAGDPAYRISGDPSPGCRPRRLARSCSTRWRRRILPLGDLGICGTNSSARMRLCGATRCATQAISAAGSLAASFFSTTKALGISPASSSALGMTAASATAGWASSTPSSSDGATCMPLYLISSLTRSTT